MTNRGRVDGSVPQGCPCGTRERVMPPPASRGANPHLVGAPRPRGAGTPDAEVPGDARGTCGAAPEGRRWRARALRPRSDRADVCACARHALDAAGAAKAEEPRRAGLLQRLAPRFDRRPVYGRQPRGTCSATERRARARRRPFRAVRVSGALERGVPSTRRAQRRATSHAAPGAKRTH